MRQTGISHYLLLITAAAIFGCVADTSSLDRFTRIDVVTGGFTKHFKESVLRVSDRGLYSAELLFGGGGPKVGANNLFLIVHDEHDRDVEGASVRIDSKYLGSEPVAEAGQPLVKEKYGGLYRIEGLSLGKSGHWVLSVIIGKAGVEDSVAFDLPEVPPAPP